MNRIIAVAASFAALTIPYAFAASTALAQSAALTSAATSTTAALAEAECHGGAPLAGIVRDSTLAIIPGTALTLDSGLHAISGADGRFQFPCVAPGPHYLTATADGFSERDLSVTTPHAASLDLVLKPQSVETAVEVDANDGGLDTSTTSTGISNTISGSQLQALADDPDDLLTELNNLAAAAGGSPSNTTIAVDGFQDSAALPPKSSIAYIKVNSDLFSAENRQPPFDGGRVEIYTKPGQKTYHGALFATNSSTFMEARDPFAPSRASLGKQRYGFEFSGPIRSTGSDFSLNLEHRSIDNFAVVNAVTLDPTSGNLTSVVANVPTPQRLWVGLARVGWQLGQKNTFIGSFSANQNHLSNLGVGGSALAETAYDSGKWDNILRFSDITTASAHLMHEARLSLRWNGEDDVPLSNTPSISVAGAFTSGGATIGNKQIHRFIIEDDDDAILTTKSHTLKVGGQFFLYDNHRELPLNFNGAYTFGGGTAPVLSANNQPTGQTTTITGVEQYRRAQLGLPGGAATAFTNVTGTPTVNFTQLQVVAFIQDDWTLPHGFKLTGGVRVAFQNQPTVTDGLVPRAGIIWSPTKKGTFTLHAHAGLFNGSTGDTSNAEIVREDGVHRVTSTVYNPIFNNPFAGATPILSQRTYAPHQSNLFWNMENIGGTYTLPYGFNLSADYHTGRFWNYMRTRNVNSPLNNLPNGPRPGPANTNILQLQNSGQGRATAIFAGVSQQKNKHVQFFFGSVYVNEIDDTDDQSFFTPQSSLTDAGEFAHRTSQPIWNLFGNGTFKFPYKIQLSGDFTAGGEAHYNITTGFDNNGDGNFVDRPQYAAPGTPGAVQTKYGLLVASGGTGVFRRNQGVMPWTFGLDTNLQRAFALSRNAKADHPQTLTVNLRSANILNHTNVTNVGGVLGSPQFGIPYAANPGRRIEAGIRYAF